MSDKLPGTGIEDKLFYTILEAADAVGIHFQTLRKWVKAGKVVMTHPGGPRSRAVVARSEVLRLLRLLEAKRAASEPSTGGTVLMRVEAIVGAENTWPLIKKLLSEWLAAHQADLDAEVVDDDGRKQKTGALLHAALEPERKETQ